MTLFKFCSDSINIVKDSERFLKSYIQSHTKVKTVWTIGGHSEVSYVGNNVDYTTYFESFRMDHMTIYAPFMFFSVLFFENNNILFFQLTCKFSSHNVEDTIIYLARVKELAAWSSVFLYLSGFVHNVQTIGL